MSQQSVRQAARRSALEAQAVRRKERADRARRLEGLAVAVLTALGECDGAVRDCAACGNLADYRVAAPTNAPQDGPSRPGARRRGHQHALGPARQVPPVRAGCDARC
jgi:hypothetical protein